MMLRRLVQLLPALAISTLVSAHGFVQQVTIDGTVYKGNNLNVGTPAASIIRLVSTNSPVKGSTNPATNCGQDAQFASLVGNANPGSQIEVLWVGGTDGSSNWPHNTGPLMHYMAKCDGSCSTYNSTNAEWFKISELGLEADGSTWYQANLESRAPVNVTIPSTLAPGNYLLRSEIISLQLAMSQGGAEFYPACIQLQIGGDQTQGPTSSEECTFPGCYSDTDPGILTPNIYNPPIQYTFPGPPVATFASTGSGSTAPAPTSSGSASGSSVGTTSTFSNVPSSTITASPSPTATGTCMLSSRSTNEDAVKRNSRNKRMLKRRLIRSH
ncbi:glycoside hydrolase family 61 protein [Suillus clintonianus]|uniref:glycoside hydrolase family 61 protein n=1 Tax=Suillus clintonianus TaxID=1904413 RepID=UPI001B8838A9|nr:glycoside hydrolase family 61 protein [Suillus clintonianus]KAG2111828.1 glycoside hydrolase family 61 protein [Suillus clintonianus]